MSKTKNILGTLLSKPIHIALFSAILSLFTIVGYNIPLLRGVAESTEEGANGIIILCSIAIIIFAVHMLLIYLLIYFGRVAGKIIIAISLLINSLALYFINSYEVLISSEMMGNVFNTRYSEASGYFSLSGILYFTLLGIVPCVWLFKTKIDYGRLKQMGITALASLGAILLVGVANLSNTLWIDRNVPRLGSIILPWSYTVNTVRYYNSWKRLNQKEILLPDATINNDNKEVCVVIIGESARSKNFSLYGYERTTNPLMTQDSVVALRAESAATYTTAGVKAIIDHQPTNKLYEILPNYLYRNGVDVIWRTNNWGEPPLHIANIEKVATLKERYPNADERYDGILTEGLAERIKSSDKNKVFVVLHTSTSHGPTYYKKYPAEFEKFTPVCTTVEMAEADHQELINAYDNTILYTDYLVHTVIEQLRTLDEWRSTMIFVSDHGESLGENNLYMHGMPKSMAPAEQFDIPFIVWHSDSERTIKSIECAEQYHVFHTTLRSLSIESEIYNPEYDIFNNTNN
jgi:lipid A ethanolaminephosphotransferase